MSDTTPAFGYTDTPIIPGSAWHVHDPERPQPRIVTPAPAATPAAAPSDAVILFDGHNLEGWTALQGGAAAWKVADGHMEVVPGAGNIRTRTTFGDCQLHIEFAEPAVIKGESQGRGNSGVFLMGLYEIQVLDGYENPTYADGITGAIYGQFPPLVNACRRPGEWQTYDIIWEGPRFDGDEVLSPARLTLLHNGIVIHHARPLQGPTKHRETTSYEPHAPEGPLVLQDHGDLVRFRNIWYRPLAAYSQE